MTLGGEQTLVCGLGHKSQFAQLGQWGYSVGSLQTFNEIREEMCLGHSTLTLFLQAIGTRQSRGKEETGRLLVSHFDQAWVPELPSRSHMSPENMLR